MQLPFNKPTYTENIDKYVLEAIRSDHLSGDGRFTKKCISWFLDKLNAKKILLTPSCTHALEMAAILMDIRDGDEVIMPSYTFVSTANPFVLRGAKIVFVDIRPDTMNIDEQLIEAAITNKTRAIVPVHYAGVSCDMDTIMEIARKHGIIVIEDAAQGMMSSYKGRPLGTIGHMGAYSFHETKNFTSGGEGGLLIINDDRYADRAEIIREKGTNRSQFFRGMIDKYSWVDIGSSYLASDLQAAHLWGQLELADEIVDDRMNSWRSYDLFLRSICNLVAEDVGIPTIPQNCRHNAHMYYLRVGDLGTRTHFIAALQKRGVKGIFHYVPLHSSIAGSKFGRFHGTDRYTTMYSEQLIRLPLWYGMSDTELQYIFRVIRDAFCEIGYLNDFITIDTIRSHQESVLTSMIG